MVADMERDLSDNDDIYVGGYRLDYIPCGNDRSNMGNNEGNMQFFVVIRSMAHNAGFLHTIVRLFSADADSGMGKPKSATWFGSANQI